MKKNEIVELVEDCKLVEIEYVDNGHDCWAKSEYNEQKYVMIKSQKELCWDGWYVIHDGKKVNEIMSEYFLERRIQDKKDELKRQIHFKKTGFDTPREYQAYIKGKNEQKE